MTLLRNLFPVAGFIASDGKSLALVAQWKQTFRALLNPISLYYNHQFESTSFEKAQTILSDYIQLR